MNSARPKNAPIDYNDIDYDRLKECMDNINHALKIKPGDNNIQVVQDDVIKAFFDLGLFLQSNFPNRELEEMIGKCITDPEFKSKFKYEIDTKDWPPLDKYHEIICAYSLAKGHIDNVLVPKVTNSNETKPEEFKKILSMTMLQQGIVIFSALMGKDFENHLVEKLVIYEKDVYNKKSEQVKEDDKKIIVLAIEKIEKSFKTFDNIISYLEKPSRKDLTNIDSYLDRQYTDPAYDPSQDNENRKNKTNINEVFAYAEFDEKTLTDIIKISHIQADNIRISLANSKNKGVLGELPLNFERILNKLPSQFRKLKDSMTIVNATNNLKTFMNSVKNLDPWIKKFKRNELINLISHNIANKNPSELRMHNTKYMAKYINSYGEEKAKEVMNEIYLQNRDQFKAYIAREMLKKEHGIKNKYRDKMIKLFNSTLDPNVQNEIKCNVAEKYIIDKLTELSNHYNEKNGYHITLMSIDSFDHPEPKLNLDSLTSLAKKGKVYLIKDKAGTYKLFDPHTKNYLNFTDLGDIKNIIPADWKEADWNSGEKEVYISPTKNKEVFYKLKEKGSSQGNKNDTVVACLDTALNNIKNNNYNATTYIKTYLKQELKDIESNINNNFLFFKKPNTLSIGFSDIFSKIKFLNSVASEFKVKSTLNINTK